MFQIIYAARKVLTATRRTRHFIIWNSLVEKRILSILFIRLRLTVRRLYPVNLFEQLVPRRAFGLALNPVAFPAIDLIDRINIERVRID